MSWCGHERKVMGCMISTDSKLIDIWTNLSKLSFSYSRAPILSTCVYESLVNNSAIEDDISDTEPKEKKCRVSNYPFMMYS